MGTSMSAKSDLENYRAGYPDLTEDLTSNDNYLFYQGKISSQPQGDFINNIHSDWWGKHSLLEAHHGYIQWLFPIRESGGLNFQSSALQKHEIQKIKENPECFEKLKKSYELMLDFYGCQFKNKETGELERNKMWKERYRNLNFHSHNYLRITRILKCLGEFELENYQKHFLLHFIDEIWVKKELSNCDNSCKNFWVGTIKNDTLRNQLEQDILKKSGNLAGEVDKIFNAHMDDMDDNHDKEDEDNQMIDPTTTKIIDPIIPPPPPTVEGPDKEREDILKKIDDNNIKENYSPTGEGDVPQSELKE